MNLKRIATGLIGIAIVIPVLLFTNKYVVDCIIAVVAMIANYEYFKVASKEVKKLSWIGYLYALGIAFIHIIPIKTGLMLLTLSVPFLMLVLFLHVICSEMKITIKDIAFTAFGVLYVTGFTMFIALLYGIGDKTESFMKVGSLADGLTYPNTVGITGKYLIWFLLWASWGSDTAAYTVGMKIGKHKFSKVSPKKSIEGCVAGVVGAVVLSCIYAYFVRNNVGYALNIPLIGVISAILCVIGQIGDFAASTIKRYFDVKDYSNIFPGHGGMLDRIDSVMFIAPFAFCIFTFVL